MNNTQLNTKEIQFAKHVFASSNSSISPRLREKAAADNVRFVDTCISLKTLISTQPTQSLLDSRVNKDVYPGIVDFSAGKVSTIIGTGAAAIKALVLGYAPKVADDSVEGKVFSPVGIPASLQHGWIEISQSGRGVICAIKISRFARQGNNPQGIYDNVLMLGTPFVLADDLETKIELKRPEGLQGEAQGYISLDMIGMQISDVATK